MCGDRPRYLPPLWERYTHPEGNVYYVRNSVPRVITSADLYDSEVQESVHEWADVVDKVLCEKDLRLSDSMELYLEFPETGEYCRYYLVDHATRTLLWLARVESNQLGILETVSGDHLRKFAVRLPLASSDFVSGFALESLYWLHVEYFPCHQLVGLNLALNELIHVFSHAQAGTSALARVRKVISQKFPDHLTSSTSTFPYNAEQNKDIVGILKNFQGTCLM